MKVRVLGNCMALEVHRMIAGFGEEMKTELVSNIINELGEEQEVDG